MYVQTAVAKGASSRRVFYRHLLPNLGPSALAELPFVAAMILSTSLFTELFMEYKGQLFQFTQAVGISMEQGDLLNPYHLGAVVVVGLVLMLLSRHGHSLPIWPPYQPWPPSPKHPFGTDTLGRDVLSDTLYGVYWTLFPAALITIFAVLAGVALAVVTSVSDKAWLVRTLQSLSRALSSAPSAVPDVSRLYQRINIEWLQLVQYILWFVLIESLRSSYAIYQSIQAWFRFAFTEGAYSLGRTRREILFVHLRSWFARYLLEFSCSTFVRVMSLMTQLAALHVYVQITIGQLPFKQFDEQMWPVGIISRHFTWFGMIGDSALSMNFLFDPAYLAAPVIALGLTVIGMNLVARGLRGGSSTV